MSRGSVNLSARVWLRRRLGQRIDEPMLAEVLAGSGADPLVYVCGPTLLVEAAADGLTNLGVPPGRIRTERFGPTT